MDNLRNYADNRNVGFCVYCGGAAETLDHVPSKVLLDDPLPDHTPKVQACRACNGGFSADEEYVACAIEVARRGSVENADVEREKVRRILSRKESLRSKLRDARLESNGETRFAIDTARVARVVVKLARGHASYELNLPQLREPHAIAAVPLDTLAPATRNAFERGFQPQVWPEVGSRAMQRAVVYPGGAYFEEWIEVQPERYRYAVSDEQGMIVRIVLSEYLAAEVSWI